MGFLPEKNPTHSLPEMFGISIERFSKALPDWLKYRALGGKHLPYRGGFLQQPNGVMDDILEIDGIFEKMVQQLFNQWRIQDEKK